MVDKEKVNMLKKKANDIRKGVLDAIYSAQSGHPGGSLSLADIMSVLYFDEMNINPDDEKSSKRDRFILSKGHAAPVLYSTLALKGYFPKEELKTLRKLGSRLQGHPDVKKIPGIDMTTGSLGQGLSIANGMAIAGKISGENYRVYVALGDGEIEEGQIWEAAMSSVKYKLDNLCVIVDNNNLQIDGTIEDVMSPYPIDSKFESFGFNVINIDGHNIEEIISAFELARGTKGRPTAIIAKTIKGKGIDFMENKASWHGKAPNEEEYKEAINELNNI